MSKGGKNMARCLSSFPAMCSSCGSIPCKSVLEAQAATFMGWRWNTWCSLDGSKHKSPDSSELQVPLSPVQGINVAVQMQEEEVAPGVGSIRLGWILKALCQRYPLGCPTPAIKVTSISSQNGFIRISKMIKNPCSFLTLCEQGDAFIPSAPGPKSEMSPWYSLPQLFQAADPTSNTRQNSSLISLDFSTLFESKSGLLLLIHFCFFFLLFFFPSRLRKLKGVINFSDKVFPWTSLVKDWDVCNRFQVHTGNCSLFFLQKPQIKHTNQGYQ